MRASFRLLFSLLFAIKLLDLNSPALAQTPSACEAILKDAEAKYRNAKNDSAIVLINSCLNQPRIAPKDKIAAYNLLAKVYVAKDDPESAKKNFKLLLQLDPNFALIPGEASPSVIQIFEEARQEKRVEKLPPFPEPPPVEEKSGFQKKLLIGGGGVVVAGVVVYLLLHDGEGGVFPDPPIRPAR